MSDGAKLYLGRRREMKMQVSTSRVYDSCAAAFPGSPQQHWFAAYTCANHERRVASELQARSVEYFLPLYHSVRRWSDRRVEIDLPLFPGYVFVRTTLRDQLRVLQVPSLVRLVGFNGVPTAVADEEINVLRSGLREDVHAEPHPFLTIGQRVRIKSGALQGLNGILLRKKRNLRVILSVALIHRSIAVDVDPVDLEEIR